MRTVRNPERVHRMIDRGSRDSLIIERRFLIKQKQDGELIETTAAELGLADQVRIQPIDPAGIAAT